MDAPKSAYIGDADFRELMFLDEESDVNHGAFMLSLSTTNENTILKFQERAIPDLDMLGMPHLPALRRQLQAVFSQKHLNVSVLVTDEWKDFEQWMLCMSELHADSSLDPLAPLKKVLVVRLLQFGTTQLFQKTHVDCLR